MKSRNTIKETELSLDLLNHCTHFALIPPLKTNNFDYEFNITVEHEIKEVFFYIFCYLLGKRIIRLKLITEVSHKSAKKNKYYYLIELLDESEVAVQGILIEQIVLSLKELKQPTTLVELMSTVFNTFKFPKSANIFYQNLLVSISSKYNWLKIVKKRRWLFFEQFNIEIEPKKKNQLSDLHFAFCNEVIHTIQDKKDLRDFKKRLNFILEWELRDINHIDNNVIDATWD